MDPISARGVHVGSVCFDYFRVGLRVVPRRVPRASRRPQGEGRRLGIFADLCGFMDPISTGSVHVSGVCFDNVRVCLRVVSSRRPLRPVGLVVYHAAVWQ